MDSPSATDIFKALHGEGKPDDFMACCPAHRDDTPSLHVTEQKDGKILLHCFAGCTQDAVLDALRAKNLWPEAGNGSSAGTTWELLEEYVYLQADRTPYLRVRKYRDEKGAKQFPQAYWDGHQWIKGKPSGPKIPYRLPELIAAPLTSPVYICEGEKDADTLVKLAMVATTASGGAKKWTNDLSEHFRNRRVVILPDADEPGRAHAQMVASALAPIAESVKVIDLYPERSDGSDVSDWLKTDSAGIKLSGAVNRAEQFVATEPTSATTTPEGEEAEILRLAALTPIAYEKERPAAAKRLGLRTTILDQLVAAARQPKQEDRAQGSALELVAREPAESEVDGSALLSGIVEQIGTYIFVPLHELVALALWVVASYAFDAFYIFPRLRLKSATKGCGKSTLLDIIEQLVNKPLIPSNITGPALFRVIAEHRPTMLLDEADRYVDGSNDLISVIDAGHKKNGTVLRCVGDDQEPRAFSVWTPMVIAAIRSLTGTVEHRAIMIDMERKPPGVRLGRFRGDRPPPELAGLASQAARWAADHQIALGNADPEMPGELGNRSADNWLPLFAVADAAGGDWPDKARRAAQAIQRVEDDELNVRLLTDIREIFATPTMHSRDLVAALNEQEGAPWATISHGRQLTQNRMARMLSDFGIRPEQVRIGGTNLNGYRLAQFAAAFAAYAPAQNTTHVAQPPHATSATPTALETQEKNRIQTSTSESACRGLESEIPEAEQSGRGCRGLNTPVGDVGTPQPTEGVCAQCNASDGQEMATSAADGPVLLHRECRRFWLKENPQPSGRVLCAVQVSEIEVEQSPVWITPKVEEVAAGHDDDIHDIHSGWRQ